MLHHCVHVFCWGVAVCVPAANRRRTKTIPRPCALFWIRLGVYNSRQAIFFSLCEACRYYCSLFAWRVNLLSRKISLTLSFVPIQPVNAQYFVLHHLVSLMQSRSVKGTFVSQSVFYLHANIGWATGSLPALTSESNPLTFYMVACFSM